MLPCPCRVELDYISDGTDTPEELLTKVAGAGLGLFSVTDHDSVRVCRIIRPILLEDGPAYLTGVEFSCRDEGGQHHIFGYGFDPDAEPIVKILEKGTRKNVQLGDTGLSNARKCPEGLRRFLADISNLIMR